MTATLVDTNVLVRFLTGQPNDQAERATRLLAEGAPGTLAVADLIVAETVYVLESVYRVERSRLAGIMRSLLGLPVLAMSDRALLIRALEVYERHGASYADAYLVARAERDDAAIVTFARGIHRLDLVPAREPG